MLLGNISHLYFCLQENKCAAHPQSMGYATSYKWTNARYVCALVETFKHNKSIHGLRVRIVDRHHSHKTLEAINGAHAHVSVSVYRFVP